MINTIAQAKKDFFVRNLLFWRQCNRRVFPWRVNREPFRVLVAELMLQRTKADQVANIYEDFMSKFPTPSKAASADPREVTEMLEHLGLRHRIPRFIELFKKLSTEYHDIVPHSFDQLTNLPGVGRYVANAVLCFGFDIPAPVVDANVVRVLSRFFGLSSSKKRAHIDPLFWDFSRKLLPKNKAADFNEAVLDFAATICTPKPRCDICPISSMCHHLGSKHTRHTS